MLNSLVRAEIEFCEFLENQAILSGGAVLTDMVKYLMRNNTIKKNSALIGGGLRFLGILPLSFITSMAAPPETPSGRLRGASTMKTGGGFNPDHGNVIQNNTALIYGDDIASYIGGIQFNTSNGYVQQELNVTGVRSGDILTDYFNVTIIDSFGKVVNLLRDNYDIMLYLTGNNDPPTFLVNEFWFTALQIQFDEAQIKLEGDLQKDFQVNYNFQTLQFKFNKIKFVGVPMEMRSFYITDGMVMQPDEDTGIFQWQAVSLKVNVFFRECIIGEIYQKAFEFYVCSPCQEGQYSLVKPIKGDLSQVCIECPFRKAVNCYESHIKLRPAFWRKYNNTDVNYFIFFCIRILFIYY